jgi:pimeloyl-ACP methyl ester carboxylesterase
MSTEEAVMETVLSRDGTRIAFDRAGTGPPLVLVHGSTADHTRWAKVRPELERQFTVYAMDRRGRGGSGDSEVYSLEAEFDDVAAVVEAAGPGASLLGHSYGALCALEAALRTSLRKLVLYEPAFGVEGLQMYEPDARRRVEELAAAGDREQLLVTFFREIVQMPEGDIEMMRKDPSWQGRLAAAHTAVRELADAEYVFDRERFSKLDVPTLLLLGSESPEMLRRPTELVAEALPNVRVAVLQGQGHVAITTAPDLFLREVLAFLTT